MTGIETSAKYYLTDFQTVCDYSRGKLCLCWMARLEGASLSKKHALPQTVDNLLYLGNNLS